MRLKKHLRFALIIVIMVISSIFLNSCAGLFDRGNKRITDEKYTSQIKEGKSDKAKVKEIFGEPGSIQKDPAMDETWSYSYKPTDRRCEICCLSITKKGKLHSLIITFREDGTVKNISKK